MEIRDVPFAALGGIYEADDREAIDRVVAAALDANGNFFPMPEESEFQTMLARHEGASKAVAVNSCGTALDCCMMALGIKAGDEVMYDKYAGTQIKIQGSEHLIVKMADVLAVLE